MELYHHGIKGQKWGIRRYQNEDGSLTTEGMKRYSLGGSAYILARKLNKDVERQNAEDAEKYNKQKKELKNKMKEASSKDEKILLKEELHQKKRELKLQKRANVETGKMIYADRSSKGRAMAEAALAGIGALGLNFLSYKYRYEGNIPKLAVASLLEGALGGVAITNLMNEISTNIYRA